MKAKDINLISVILNIVLIIVLGLVLATNYTVEINTPCEHFTLKQRVITYILGGE